MAIGRTSLKPWWKPGRAATLIVPGEDGALMASFPIIVVHRDQFSECVALVQIGDDPNHLPDFTWERTVH